MPPKRMKVCFLSFALHMALQLGLLNSQNKSRSPSRQLKGALSRQSRFGVRNPEIRYEIRKSGTRPYAILTKTGRNRKRKSGVDPTKTERNPTRKSRVDPRWPDLRYPPLCAGGRLACCRSRNRPGAFGSSGDRGPRWLWFALVSVWGVECWYVAAFRAASGRAQ